MLNTFLFEKKKQMNYQNLQQKKLNYQLEVKVKSEKELLDQVIQILLLIDMLQELLKE
jgi:hypothetical protein